MENNATDTLFSRSFYVDTDAISYLYLGDSLFQRQKKKSTITSFEQRRIDLFDFIDYFLDGWLVHTIIDGAFIHNIDKEYIGKAKVLNQVCHKITYSTYNEEDASLVVMTIYINVEDYLPVKFVTTFEHMGLVQFTEKTISSYKINKKRKYFSNFFEGTRHVASIPDILEYPPNNKSQKSLLFESAYNKLGILKTIDEVTIDTLDLTNKVVLIDFWYMGCPPCLKAIPIIKKIQGNYKKEDLIIIGINPFDSRNKKLLKHFLAKNDMTYSIVLGNGELSQNFNTKSYPTFVLLDKNGIIQFEQKGYDENLYSTLTTKINSILKLEN
ncbi:TlpA disulfide reductase family protein [Aureispira anguillae]|uniref:TlpA disulfide reductase family protein n=1 Tax=Aureispira anguillae TaxID=2864201 RepID=UPI00222FB419|nr:TlpA disulfide reductase family protein [Aureispira anguillae]